MSRPFGSKLSESHKNKISKAKIGWKHSIEHRMKNSMCHKGSKSHLWKGGITPKNESIRRTIEFRLWRESVFARDNWTCQKCKIKSGDGKLVYLQAHHIKSFSDYPELRFAIDNGLTLCRDCHKKTDNYAGRNKCKKNEL